MSDDVKMIITITGAVVILAWVLTNASSVTQVAGGLASGYATAVHGLEPGSQIPGGLTPNG